MKRAKLSNVAIKDLLVILNRLATHHDAINIIIDIEKKTLIVDPIERTHDDSELTDENIYTLI